MNALELTGLSKRFGGVQAVDNLSFSVDQGEAVGIIGPNGAGKTTVFNLITGFYRSDSGSVAFFGNDITHIDPSRPVLLGMARTFQNLRLFKSLTVVENVLVPILIKEGYGPTGAIFRSSGYVKAGAAARKKALELLDFFSLAAKMDQRANILPYGEQRRLELARALAANPRLLLIDEPAAGMNPREVQDLLENLRKIRSTFDLTILIIEHQMNLVMNLSDRIIVMEFGKKIAEDTPEAIRKNEKVIEAYLGVSK
jgi:branched-chain amino acid transport system ATP-binding protein